MSNILVTRHDKIGDFIVSLPIFKCLKDARPNDKVIALVSKINVPLAEKVPYIDSVIEYRRDDMGYTLSEIKKANCNISISAFIDDRLGFLLWRAGIPKRLAPATKVAQIWFNKRVKQRRSEVKKTEIEYNLDLLKAFDSSISVNYSRPLLNFDKNDVDHSFNAFCEDNDIDSSLPIIGFHPGSGGSTDGNLSVDDYINLATSALKYSKCNIVFTFGPDDIELYSIVKEALPSGVVLYQSNTSIYEFALVLSRFTLFISTSTGPMHLAAGANITTLSFFGENKVASPARWSSVNDSDKQNNFQLTDEYSNLDYEAIEKRLHQIVSGHS